MNEQDFVYLVSQWLNAQFPQSPHAFAVDPQSRGFCYALSVMKGAKWHSVVNLLQGLSYITQNDHWTIKSFRDIYTNEPQWANNGMAGGMAEFLDKKIKAVPSYPATKDLTILDGKSEATVIWSKLTGIAGATVNARYIPAAALVRSPGDSQKVPQGDPDVDLTGKRATHLHRLYMLHLIDYVSTRLMGPSVQNGYPIAAMMVTPRGKVLGWAANSVYWNYTYHAEVNLVQAVRLWGKCEGKPPIIYSTLKPCCMWRGVPWSNGNLPTERHRKSLQDAPAHPNVAARK